MNHPFISAAFAAALLGAAPAGAQNVAADLLPPHEVATIVASMGMRLLDRPVWRDGRYVVNAIDRHGREVRVVLDARDGHVLAVRPRGYAHDPGPRYAPPPPRGYRGAPPDDPRYDAPPPPAAIPGPPPGDDDDEFFDDDEELGAATPPAVIPAPAAAASRAARPSSAAPLPRPRPEQFARAPQEAKAPNSVTAAAEPAEKKDIRVIEISKPKPAPEADKPGEAIRF